MATLAEMVVEVRFDASKAKADARALTSSLASDEVKFKVGLDAASAKAQIDRITSDWVGKKIDIPVGLDGAKAKAEAAAVANSIEHSLRPVDVEITAEDRATATVDALKARLAGLDDADQQIVLKVAADQAQAEIAALDRQLADLEGDDVDVLVKARDEATAVLNKVQGEIEETEKKAVSSFQGMGRQLASAFSAVAVGSFFKDAIAGASELEQAVGGSAAIFKESVGIIDEFAAKSAQAVGLSEAAFRSTTTILGAQLRTIGGTLDETAQKAIELTSLGADLAATFGGSTADAVGAITAALRNEFDTIERFGITLTAVAVANEAVRMGLADTATEVSESAKKMATISLITQQSADALGQFTREADTAAGGAQRLAAEFENMKADIGQALLPVFSDIVGALRGVIDVFGQLPGGVQTAIVAMAGIAVVAGPLVNITRLVSLLTVAIKALGVASLSNPWTALAVGIAAAGVAIFTLATRATEAEKALERTKKVAEDLAGAFGESADPMQDLTDYVTEYAAGNDILREAMVATGTTAGEMASAVLAGGTGFQELTRYLVSSAAASGASTEEFTKMADLLNGDFVSGFRAALDLYAEMEVVAGRSATKQEAIKKLLDGTADAATGAAEAVDVASTALGGIDGSAEGAAYALEAIGGAFQLLAEQANIDALVAYMTQLQEALVITREYADVTSSMEWDTAGIQGATAAFEEYSAAQFAFVDYAVSRRDAIAGFAETLSKGFNFENVAANSAEAINSLKGVAAVVETTLVGAFDAANGSQEAFVANATGIGDSIIQEMGLAGSASEDLARDLLNLTEEDYIARFELAGDAEAVLKLQLLSGLLEDMPDEVKAEVRANILADDPQAAVQAIKDQVEAESLTVTVQTTADVLGARTDLAGVTEEEYLATVNAVAQIVEAQTQLDGMTDEERKAAIVAVADMVAAAGGLDGLTNEQRQAMIDAIALTSVAEGKFTDIEEAKREAEIVLAAILGQYNTDVTNATKAREMRVILMADGSVKNVPPYVTVPVRLQASKKSSGAGSQIAEADGGIIQNGAVAFASGGHNLPDQARIQKPGTLVQWAEPETGGESFIPLAKSKRARSRQVWLETGRRLDMINFADGGMTTAAATARLDPSSDTAERVKLLTDAIELYHIAIVDASTRAAREAAEGRTEAAAQTEEQTKAYQAALLDASKELDGLVPAAEQTAEASVLAANKMGVLQGQLDELFVKMDAAQDAAREAALAGNDDLVAQLGVEYESLRTAAELTTAQIEALKQPAIDTAALLAEIQALDLEAIEISAGLQPAIVAGDASIVAAITAGLAGLAQQRSELERRYQEMTGTSDAVANTAGQSLSAEKVLELFKESNSYMAYETPSASDLVRWATANGYSTSGLSGVAAAESVYVPGRGYVSTREADQIAASAAANVDERVRGVAVDRQVIDMDALSKSIVAGMTPVVRQIVRGG